MITLFAICLAGFIITIPINILSLEHKKLEEIFGSDRGDRIGKMLAMIGGWGLFIFWIGIWMAPQLRFIISPFGIIYVIPYLNIQTSLLQVILFALFFIPGMYLGLRGVMDLGLEVSETHKPERVIKEGIYSKIRHPQYLGGMLSHVGITFLLSAYYSLISTPIILILMILLAWWEEKKLSDEFGEDYLDYKRRTPMFIPKIL